MSIPESFYKIIYECSFHDSEDKPSKIISEVAFFMLAFPKNYAHDSIKWGSREAYDEMLTNKQFMKCIQELLNRFGLEATVNYINETISMADGVVITSGFPTVEEYVDGILNIFDQIFTEQPGFFYASYGKLFIDTVDCLIRAYAHEPGCHGIYDVLFKHNVVNTFFIQHLGDISWIESFKDKFDDVLQRLLSLLIYAAGNVKKYYPPNFVYPIMDSLCCWIYDKSGELEFDLDSWIIILDAVWKGFSPFDNGQKIDFIKTLLDKHKPTQLILFFSLNPTSFYELLGPTEFNETMSKALSLFDNTIWELKGSKKTDVFKKFCDLMDYECKITDTYPVLFPHQKEQKVLYLSPPPPLPLSALPKPSPFLEDGSRVPKQIIPYIPSPKEDLKQSFWDKFISKGKNKPTNGLHSLSSALTTPLSSAESTPSNTSNAQHTSMMPTIVQQKTRFHSPQAPHLNSSSNYSVKPTPVCAGVPSDSQLSTFVNTSCQIPTNSAYANATSFLENQEVDDINQQGDESSVRVCLDDGENTFTPTPEWSERGDDDEAQNIQPDEDQLGLAYDSCYLSVICTFLEGIQELIKNGCEIECLLNSMDMINSAVYELFYNSFEINLYNPIIVKFLTSSFRIASCIKYFENLPADLFTSIYQYIFESEDVYLAKSLINCLIVTASTDGFFGTIVGEQLLNFIGMENGYQGELMSIMWGHEMYSECLNMFSVMGMMLKDDYSPPPEDYIMIIIDELLNENCGQDVFASLALFVKTLLRTFLLKNISSRFPNLFQDFFTLFNAFGTNIHIIETCLYIMLFSPNLLQPEVFSYCLEFIVDKSQDDFLIKMLGKIGQIMIDFSN